MGKHGIKGGPDGPRADHSGATGVDTHNIILLGPAGHEFFDIGGLKRLVKGRFNVIRGTA